MIVLDTNVVSEMMRPSPEAPVIGWLNRQEAAALYVSTITVAEIGYGLQVMPAGKRRRSLEARFEKFVATGFAHRVLDFDMDAARSYGEIMGRRKKLGRPMGILDGQIAAIARAHGFVVATRNVRDFKECGLDIINPFQEAD